MDTCHDPPTGGGCVCAERTMEICLGPPKGGDYTRAELHIKSGEADQPGNQAVGFLAIPCGLNHTALGP
eukprot:scaffold108381_cov17-Tisochrysis_lutea.AAC.1